MKYINVIACIIFSCSTIFSQKVINETLNTAGASHLKMTFEFADIQIEYWDRNEINVTGNVLIAMGEKNDNHKLTLQKNGDKIELISEVENEDDIPYMVIAYDNEGNVAMRKRAGKRKKGDSWGDMGDNIVDANGNRYKSYNYTREIEIALVIKVPRGIKVQSESIYGDTKIKQASGPIDINNIYGSVEVKFTPNAKIENSVLESTYDFVDVSIPTSSKASIRMQSNYGDLLTDLELVVDKAKSKSGSFNEVIYANVNGGGPTIEMKATYDNVYLRKGL